MPQPSVRTEYEKRLVGLYQFIQELQKQDTVEGLSKAALHYLREWFQFDLIWIAQYEAQYQVLTGLEGLLPNPDRDKGILYRKQPVLAGDLFDQVLLTGNLQEIPSLKQEQRAGDWQTIANHQNIQGTVILPIRYRNRPLGILVVSTTLWGGHPRAEEMVELKMLARSLGSEFARLNQNAASVATESGSPPLIELLSQMLAKPSFEERLKLALEYLHNTLQPSRTCLYWFYGEEQSCRLKEIYTSPSPRRSNAAKTVPSIEISIPAIAAFFQSSLQNQTVAISDVQGVVNSNQAPTRLMNLTRSRAWLSAPLLDRGRLIAVLAVEENEPRLWSETEKQSIQLMAQVMGQNVNAVVSDHFGEGSEAFGLNGLLSTLNNTDGNQAEWDKVLLHCLEKLSLQFAVRWAAVLTHQPEENDFSCRAQFFQKKKQPLPDHLPDLSPVDTKLLLRLSAPLAIQSIEQDLRLLAWRQPLADRGVQSFLLLKLNVQEKLGSFLLIATDLPRTWTETDTDTAVLIAEPLGQAIARRDQRLMDTLQVAFMTGLNQGLQTLQRTPSADKLIPVAAQTLQDLLAVECLVILLWTPDQPEARVAALINHSKFQINEDSLIPWQTDGFVQWVLTQATPYPATGGPPLVTARGTLEDLPTPSGGWLAGRGRIEVLGVPLRLYPEDPCLGLVLALDSRRQHWSAFKREGIKALVQALAVQHRSHHLIQQLQQRQNSLECLNWYKQRHLEYLSRLWSEQMAKFQVLMSSQAFGGSQNGNKGRGRQPMGELYNAFTTLEAMLKNEIWDLQLEPDNIPVATLLRRSLERIEEVAQTRQLWTQVHNLTPSVLLQVPAHKLELMLVELLLAACYRSKVGDRIDIWCRALPEQWVEISITDNGRLNPLLVSAIQYPTEQLSLKGSVLETLPGLHFKICQTLMEQLGGKLELAQLEDGRSLSRLILPLAPTLPSA